jgi:hypothetical protein
MPVQDSMDEEAEWVPFTIRLTRKVHDWLRTEAFYTRASMSDIVREEVDARMARSSQRYASPGIAAIGGAVSGTGPMRAVGETTGPIGIVKP